AANALIGLQNGVIVDVGGGTTGIAILREGEVVYTADEPTGGIHADLVLAGHFKISDDEAETMKCDPSRQAELFTLIRPVFEKMASIVNYHLAFQSVDILYLVGGTSEFPGIEQVMEKETGFKVLKPLNPLLVTPLGIALSCWKAKLGSDACARKPDHG
ncbi:MAG: ethanolamine utilization protein EutJ, partial [Planctomycetota bacterium]